MSAPVWWREASADARRALVAASLGWMLDAFDVMLYALVLPAVVAELRIDYGLAGVLASLTLVASALGGVLFGLVADRYGRTRALMFSILLYSAFTAACGLAQSFAQLAIFRLALGFGFGGEWASGAALVAETWPARHRGKAFGIVQSSWAVGYALAALVTLAVLPRYGWRAVFFVGVLPALLTFWIRRSVREPEAWRQSRAAASEGAHDKAAASVWAGLGSIFVGRLGSITAAITLMNACVMFAYWGFNTWAPTYLSAPISRGGAALDVSRMTLFIVVMQVGTWLGYVTFGFVADRIGVKRTYVVYLLAAAALLPIYTSVRAPFVLLVLGPVLAFFATGHFSGFGALTAALYPTAIRATAQGFTYNIGRLASAVAPFLVGTLADRRGFAAALSVAALAYLGAALMWVWIPRVTSDE
jgi:MFS family permease